MKGTLYGIGVGPGDPELLTLQAVRIIRESDVIFAPGKVPEETTAYQIAAGAVPEIASKKAAGKMKEWGFYPDLMPEIYDSVHLAKTLTEHVDKDEKILLPRARMGSRELTDILEEAGISVADLPLYDTCYESQSFIDLKKEFEEGISDYAVFTSTSTVRGFVNAASDLDLSKVTALCIGEKTEKEARKSGMITYTARRADVKSLVLLAEEMENPWADRKKS